MKRTIASVLPALCLAAVLCPARPALAQTDLPLAATTAPDIIITPETHTHGISATTAARLSATAPKFVPPPAPGADTRAAEVRIRDKPKNGIVRLPDYIINEPKAPAFKERELLTGYGRLQLGLKRYPGLRFGSLPFLSNNGWALAMLEEDFRLERKAEMEDLSNLITSPTARAKAKDETQQVFMRTSAP
jgi:hypothetical protein